MVVGGFGSVGSAIACLLAAHLGRLIVVGRPGSGDRARQCLRGLEAAIRASAITPGAHRLPGSVADRLLAGEAVRDGTMPTLGYVGESAQAWGQAQVVVTATNALGALVEPMLLAPEAVVCDVSRPFNIPTDLATLRPDVTVIEGGIIAPHGEFDLGVDLGIGRRHCYACMAETMLLALEQAPDRGSVGASISPANLHWLRNVAARAGFRTVLDPAPEAQR